jgi:hypothetical protein
MSHAHPGNHNHEIQGAISTAINTALQNGRSPFLTGTAITTRACIATAAHCHWLGHKSSTAINNGHPAAGRNTSTIAIQPLLALYEC